jgi:hypothetical protein
MALWNVISSENIHLYSQKLNAKAIEVCEIAKDAFGNYNLSRNAFFRSCHKFNAGN